MKTCDKYQQACFKLHIKTIEHIRKQQNVCIECDLFFEHELFESNVLWRSSPIGINMLARFSGRALG